MARPGKRSDVESIVRALKRIKRSKRDELKSEHQLALRYLKNKQREDVEQELLKRHRHAQYGTTGQEIFPLCLPLTERFVAEQATAYNKSVKRKFVDEEGNETDSTREQTTKLNAALNRARYDELLHANDRFTVLLKTSTMLFQEKRGQLRPTIHYPHDVYPVLPENAMNVDKSDPDDYAGYAIELHPDMEDISRASYSKYYMYMTREERTFYRGSHPHAPDEILEREPTTFKWEQRTGLKTTSIVPGRMLTFWHNTLVPDELIVQTDATIARINRELNVAYSLLYDTIRFQSHATPVLNVTNPTKYPVKHAYGARHPVVLGPVQAESFKLEKSEAPYTEIVSTLDYTAKFMATLLRNSPNDFSVEGQKAISGFAKLVDSLPKIDARHERLRALTWLEENEAGPPLIAVLVRTGDLDPVVTKMRLVTEFEDIEFPLSPDERASELETNFRYNFTTAAKELAEMKGITVEEATREIQENRTVNTELRQQQQENMYKALINKRGSGNGQRPDEAQGDAPRPNRFARGSAGGRFGGSAPSREGRDGNSSGSS